MQLTATDIFAPFAGHAGSIVSFVRMMQERGLTPADVLQLYDRYMEEMLAAMQAPPPAAAAAVAPDPDVRRPAGQADTELRLGACPRCGAEVWGIRKCAHIAPPWRTFFACDAPDCAYHGRSRLTVDVLRRQWPVGAEAD